MRTRIRKAQRLVIKVGSTLVTNNGAGLDHAALDEWARQIAALRKGGREIVLVSSGAIAAGRETLGLTCRPDDMATLQAAASIGQVSLIETYSSEFGRCRCSIGQVLLTRADTENLTSYGHACNTFERLLELGSIPIVNENDTVAIDEICFGDNDTLASLVALMIEADMVVILTDVKGLYDADPAKNADARVVSYLTEIDDDLLASTAPAAIDGQSLGSGGMRSKLEAARALLDADIITVLSNGREANVVIDAVCGKPHGTVICSQEQMKQFEVLT